jgi:hypothetical protein
MPCVDARAIYKLCDRVLRRGAQYAWAVAAVGCVLVPCALARAQEHADSSAAISGADQACSCHSPCLRARTRSEAWCACSEATTPLLVGLDARPRFVLGSEEEKREQEGGAEYELVVGPTASYA